MKKRKVKLSDLNLVKRFDIAHRNWRYYCIAMIAAFVGFGALWIASDLFGMKMREAYDPRIFTKIVVRVLPLIVIAVVAIILSRPKLNIYREGLYPTSGTISKQEGVQRIFIPWDEIRQIIHRINGDDYFMIHTTDTEGEHFYSIEVGRNIDEIRREIRKYCKDDTKHLDLTGKDNSSLFQIRADRVSGYPFILLVCLGLMISFVIRGGIENLDHIWDFLLSGDNAVQGINSSLIGLVGGIVFLIYFVKSDIFSRNSIEVYREGVLISGANPPFLPWRDIAGISTSQQGVIIINPADSIENSIVISATRKQKEIFKSVIRELQKEWEK